MVDEKPTLRLLRDVLPSGGRTSFSAVRLGRIVYLVDGSGMVSFEGGRVDLRPNEAQFIACPVSLDAGSAGATLLRWELVSHSDRKHSEGTERETGAKIELEAPISLPAEEFLMRCDRVDFPPGGVAYTHVHRGPGIRCLLHGEITVTVHDELKRISPQESWFEAGPDPVFAAASETQPTAFVRVMILPSEIQGKSSITYINEEDLAKPKSQQYTIFVDQLLSPQARSKVSAISNRI
jgi:hypothetical protein